MKKLKLPAIIAGVKNRPLSYNPRTKKFIYYEDIENGEDKLIPIEYLSEKDLIKLAAERQRTNIPTTTVFLDGREFTNEEIASEIEKKSKIGIQFLNIDINYLKYYLSSFPSTCFARVRIKA